MERIRREGGRRPPDRAPVLLAAHRAALAELERRAGGRRVVLAGKSLGGRMASLLAAEGCRCDGLAFFGYPLHPAKKPEKLRSEHFPAIAQPALFLQGTRDALCDLELLRRELETFGGVTRLVLVEDGDHDFQVRRSSGRTREEVLGELVRAFVEWEEASSPD